MSDGRVKNIFRQLILRRRSKRIKSFGRKIEKENNDEPCEDKLGLEIDQSFSVWF